MIILISQREPLGPGPCLHPWARFWPADTQIIRDELETGSMALAALPEGAVVARKSVADFLDAMGWLRESFEAELARSRHLGSFCVIIEGDLEEVIVQARGLKQNAIMATVATWTRRYGPILFAGGERAAADLAYRFLTGQVREIERVAKALRKISAVAEQ